MGRSLSFYAVAPLYTCSYGYMNGLISYLPESEVAVVQLDLFSPNNWRRITPMVSCTEKPLHHNNHPRLNCRSYSLTMWHIKLHANYILRINFFEFPPFTMDSKAQISFITALKTSFNSVFSWILPQIDIYIYILIFFIDWNASQVIG